MTAAKKKQNGGTVKRRPAARRTFSAQEKLEAVLSVWSERRKPAEVCKEMGIKWANLSQWQNQGLEAMLVVFEPRVRREEDRGPALGPKLEKLLQKKLRQREGSQSKVDRRLQGVQASAARPKK